MVNHIIQPIDGRDKDLTISKKVPTTVVTCALGFVSTEWLQFVTASTCTKLA